MSKKIDELLPAFPFRYADFNFYRAAQSSLNAELLWPSLNATSPTEVLVRDLCLQLLPLADEGLDVIGVDDEERAKLLGVIRDRLESKTTPAAWQRRTLEGFGHMPRTEALQRLVEEYLSRVASGKPVAEW